MKTTGSLTLKKAAKASGGDRYTGELKGESLDIYIPQVVSRPEGASSPVEVLKIVVEAE